MEAKTIKERHRSASSAACAADAFRHGTWALNPAPKQIRSPYFVAHPNSQACSNFTYGNASCMADELTTHGLCHSLRHSHLLMVGDSLMHHAFLALLEFTNAKVCVPMPARIAFAFYFHSLHSPTICALVCALIDHFPWY